jgi:hypothetical protein
MKCRSVGRRLATGVCIVGLGFAGTPARTAGDTFKRSAELGKKTAKTSDDVDKYVAQLDKTEQALASVSQAQSKDLKKRYEFLSKEIDSLGEVQKQATSDIEQMKSTGSEYFSAWGTSIAQMSNPELRQASSERRSKIMKDHDNLVVSLNDIGSDLQPFMSNLHDLKSFMETDLSPENVDKAGEMIRKSQSDALALKGKIDGAQMTLKQFLSEAPR